MIRFEGTVKELYEEIDKKVKEEIKAKMLPSFDDFLSHFRADVEYGEKFAEYTLPEALAAIHSLADDWCEKHDMSLIKFIAIILENYEDIKKLKEKCDE